MSKNRTGHFQGMIVQAHVHKPTDNHSHALKDMKVAAAKKVQAYQQKKHSKNK